MSQSDHRRQPVQTVRFDSAETDPKQPTEEPLNRHQVEQIAQRFRIPLYEDPGVVEALARLDMSATIPLEIYGVISEVLGFVYRLDNEKSELQPDKPSPTQE
jgi:flagellar biosynthesis protein